MVKASNLIKKLLPIGLVIGGLYFLSQSKRVNIFKTTQPPDITLNPTKAYPIFINEPQFIPVPFQETEQSLTDRYGPLYTKNITQVETAASRRGYAQMGSRGNWGPNTLRQARANYERTYETIEQYTPLFQLE
ncbi:MAG: hypothetical protein [Circular genetic element sp.]|jgi:hypothetical protein|nr:MAG: hypothetical protein [Circular genetic element sp.]|tara:strand:- start:769 stop:1167 length:399 start_codon:yes stop_codon:yes gene_type:complete